MMERTAVPVVVCALSAAIGSKAAETDVETAPRPPRPEARGLNLLVSGIFASERHQLTSGFLLGGGVEVPVGSGIDLNLGMSFERLRSLDGPVTLVNALEATMARNAPTAVFLSGNAPDRRRRAPGCPWRRSASRWFLGRP